MEKLSILNSIKLFFNFCPNCSKKLNYFCIGRLLCLNCGKDYRYSHL